MRMKPQMELGLLLPRTYVLLLMVFCIWVKNIKCLIILAVNSDIRRGEQTVHVLLCGMYITVNGVSNSVINHSSRCHEDLGGVEKLHAFDNSSNPSKSFNH